MKLERRVCPHCRGKGETYEPVPGELRRRRESLKLSLRRVARWLGYSASYLSDIELGKKPAPLTIVSGYEGLS